MTPAPAPSAESPWLRRLPLLLAAGFCALFVGLPLVAMLVDSVSTPDGVSFGVYAGMMSESFEREQMLYSLELGFAATAIATLLGFGHAWLTCGTDLPGARWLGPLGIGPLVVPPIFVAMGFADLMPVAGFFGCAMLLGVSYAPFVAVLTARGMRAVDGRIYESAWLARGRRGAERMLLRTCLPEIAAGCLLAFVFVISEHGVPEFLTVKGKTWHTYAEGIFAKWTRRATGSTEADLAAPIVAAVPLVAIILIALAAALRLRARATVRGDFHRLPLRTLGPKLRWVALGLPVVFLGCGVGVPVFVMARWAAGSTDATAPMSFEVFRNSFQNAWTEASGDLGYTLGIGAATAVVTILVALPLARASARTWSGIDKLTAIPIAVPAVLLAIGLVHVFNSDPAAAVYEVTGDFYDSPGIVIAGYAARLLPFGVLTLSSIVRRIPRSLEDSARLANRSSLARTTRINLPLLAPATWSAACLVFILAVRELDVSVVLPAGNGTVVRRLSNVVHFGGEDVGGALALMLLATAVGVPALIAAIAGRRPTPLS